MTRDDHPPVPPTPPPHIPTPPPPPPHPPLSFSRGQATQILRVAPAPARCQVAGGSSSCRGPAPALRLMLSGVCREVGTNGVPRRGLSSVRVGLGSKRLPHTRLSGIQVVQDQAWVMTSPNQTHLKITITSPSHPPPPFRESGCPTPIYPPARNQ